MSHWFWHSSGFECWNIDRFMLCQSNTCSLCASLSRSNIFVIHSIDSFFLFLLFSRRFINSTRIIGDRLSGIKCSIRFFLYERISCLYQRSSLRFIRKSQLFCWLRFQLYLQWFSGKSRFFRHCLPIFQCSIRFFLYE